MGERIDISPEVRALCDKFGIGHDDVLRLVIHPNVVEVLVGLRNDRGKFYIEGPNETLVTDIRTFEVAT